MQETNDQDNADQFLPGKKRDANDAELLTPADREPQKLPKGSNPSDIGCQSVLSSTTVVCGGSVSSGSRTKQVYLRDWNFPSNSNENAFEKVKERREGFQKKDMKHAHWTLRDNEKCEVVGGGKLTKEMSFAKVKELAESWMKSNDENAANLSICLRPGVWNRAKYLRARQQV